MLSLLLPLVLLVQEPAPPVGFEPLPYTGPELLEITATTHPDPASAPEDAFLEVTGHIADYDPAVNVGVLCGRAGTYDGPDWHHEATIDADGSFHVWLEPGDDAPSVGTWAPTVAEGVTWEVHVATVRTDAHEAKTADGDDRLDVHTQPHLGTGGRWNARLVGDGPWQLDVGELTVAPAPLVLEARVDLSGASPTSEEPAIYVIAGPRRGSLWKTAPLAIEHATPLRLFSWSVRPGSTWTLLSSGIRAVGRQTFDSPSFRVPARVRAAVVPWLDVEFETTVDLGDRKLLLCMLVPDERSDELDRWIRSWRTQELWLAANLRGVHDGRGSEVHDSRNFRRIRAVPPRRFQLVAFESDEPGDFLHPIRTTRLGPIDLSGLEAGTVRVAVDLELGDARIVAAPPASIPSTLDESQSADPLVRTEPLPLDRAPVVELVAAPHPDPESLPDGVVLEVVGRIDSPEERDAVGEVAWSFARTGGAGGVADEGAEQIYRPVRSASFEPDGSFRLEMRGAWPVSEPARRLVLWTRRPAPKMDVPASVDWSITGPITAEPLPGFRGRWDLTAKGDGPWRVDVGTLALAPAPMVLEVRITAPGSDDGAPIQAQIVGGARPIDWQPHTGEWIWIHSDPIPFPRDARVRLHSWSPPSSNPFHLAQIGTTDDRMLWSPNFVLPARIACAMVDPLDLEFHVAPTAPERGTTSFLGLVPMERADEIEENGAGLMGGFWPHDPRSGRGVGKPVHWIRHFADTARVPPARYELWHVHSRAPDFVERMKRGPCNAATVHPQLYDRLGSIDLRERTGTVRVAIDLEANSARVLPREDAEPVSDGDEER